MGRYKRKCEEKEEEEEEEKEVVVDSKIQGRAMAEGRRMNMTTTKTKTKKKKKEVFASTTPYNVYALRSRRRKTSHNSTETTAFEETANGSCSGSGSDIVSCSDLQASCCSSNIASSLSAFTQNSASTSSEIVQDLEVESGGETSSKFVGSNKSVSEIGTSKLNTDSKSDTEPAVQIKSSMMMPSEVEIEEFFSSAEKDLHNHFSDKYNFDVVKDVPLEGRYEWVEIKP